MAATLRLLEAGGPALGHLVVDTLKGSKVANLKELRLTGEGGGWQVAFDRRSIAVLLAAGKQSRSVRDRVLSDSDGQGGTAVEHIKMSKTNGVTLDEMSARTPPDDQRELAARAVVLIAQHVALRDVRKARRKIQEAVAKQLGISQENAARIEQRGDMLLSNLRGLHEVQPGTPRRGGIARRDHTATDTSTCVNGANEA